MPEYHNPGGCQVQDMRKETKSGVLTGLGVGLERILERRSSFGRMLTRVALAVGFSLLPAVSYGDERILKAANANVQIKGTRANMWYGFSTATGDVNGDGIDDVIAAGNDEIGVEYGDSNWNEKSTTITKVSSDADFRITGTNILRFEAINNYRSPMAAADVDGDGYVDIAFGNFREDTKGRANAGVVRIVRGGNYVPGTVKNLDTESPAMIIHGPEEAGLGMTVVAGDVLGDDKADIIIGAFYSAGLGKIYIIKGQNPLPSEIDLATQSADYTINVRDPGDAMGLAIAAGNVGGDAKGDIIFSSYAGDGADNLKKDVGEIYIKHGSETLSGTLNLATENPDATIFGIDENEYSGVSLVLCDINGDGNKDLVLTVPYSEGKKNGDSTYGEAWAVFGPIAAGERDLAVDRPNTIFYGKGGVRGFPNKVTCGNLNNDKRNGNILEDLILSSPQETADVGEDDAGRLYILNGRAAWPTVFDLDKEDASTIIKGEFIGDGYSGSGLASGDIDDDGFMDIITAAFLHDADGKVDTGKVYVSLSPVIAHFQKPAGTTCWTWADENNDGSNDAFDICHDYIPTLNASDYYRFVLGQWGRADAVYCCKPIDAEPGGDYVKFRDKGQDGQPAPDPNKSYAWLFIGVVNDENGNPKEQSRGERCEPDGTCEERSPPSNACDPQPPCP